MTTEEKLKYFEESSLEEARKQAAAMIEEYKVNLTKVEEEHKATTLRQSDLQLKTESDNLKRSNNMALSKEQLQIKRKITQKQNELKEKLFVEVKQQLEDCRLRQTFQSPGCNRSSCYRFRIFLYGRHKSRSSGPQHPDRQLFCFQTGKVKSRLLI